MTESALDSPDARPFFLTIDIEPDDRTPDVAGEPGWDGFQIAAERMEQVRAALTSATGNPARFSWFIRADPQIESLYGDAGWALSQYKSDFDRLESRGDELGLHVHMYRWDERARSWSNQQGDPSWVRRCVDIGVTSFARHRAAPLHAFRYGDRWMDETAAALLEEYGLTFDLTLEPGMKSGSGHVPTEINPTPLPDFRSVPRKPYRPERGDFRRPSYWDPRPVWMIPVTTACVNGAAFPAQVTEAHDMVHLNLGLRHEWIGPMFDAVLASEQPVIMSVARTGDLSIPDAAANFDRNLEYLSSHPALSGVRFVTPSEWGSAVAAGAR